MDGWMDGIYHMILTELSCVQIPIFRSAVPRVFLGQSTFFGLAEHRKSYGLIDVLKTFPWLH